MQQRSRKLEKIVQLLLKMAWLSYPKLSRGRRQPQLPKSRKKPSKTQKRRAEALMISDLCLLNGFTLRGSFNYQIVQSTMYRVSLAEPGLLCPCGRSNVFGCTDWIKFARRYWTWQILSTLFLLVYTCRVLVSCSILRSSSVTAWWIFQRFKMFARRD